MGRLSISVIKRNGESSVFETLVIAIEVKKVLVQWFAVGIEIVRKSVKVYGWPNGRVIGEEGCVSVGVISEH